MAVHPFIQSVTVDGKEIQRLIFDRLMPAVEGEPLSHSILSLITFSVMLMKPDIDLETLQKLVLSTSEHIIMNIAPVGTPN